MTTTIHSTPRRPIETNAILRRSLRECEALLQKYAGSLLNPNNRMLSVVQALGKETRASEQTSVIDFSAEAGVAFSTAYWEVLPP